MFSQKNLPDNISTLRNQAYAETYAKQARAMVNFGQITKSLFPIFNIIKFRPDYLFRRRILRLLLLKLINLCIGDKNYEKFKKLKISNHIDTDQKENQKDWKNWWEENNSK